jgi:flagellar motor switch protein FliN
MSPISPGEPEVSASEAGALPPADPAAARVDNGTIDLLMDMEMPLLVRFGSTRMLLSSILALGPGSVVEFRRGPDDPVDLLVNGRVVARAAVVVVQGNYGVRIIEIATQRDAVVGEHPAARTIRGN